MDIKVCNLRDYGFEQSFISSVMDTGFAVLTHHGIDHGFIKETQQAWRLFFLNDKEYKENYINTADGNLGYHQFKKEKALGATKADLKEFFHWKPGAKLPSEVLALTQHMFFQLEDVSSKLLSTLDTVLIGTKYRENCENSDSTILRTLYYPALNFESETGATRSAAHEDVNYITLLVAASAPGLQVKDREGKWHDVPHEENSIVVNIGDMLQLESNGLFKSTTHRVINPSYNHSDRVSMPLFTHPHGNTILDDGITARDFLNNRIKAIYTSK